MDILSNASLVMVLTTAVFFGISSVMTSALLELRLLMTVFRVFLALVPDADFANLKIPPAVCNAYPHSSCMSALVFLSALQASL